MPRAKKVGLILFGVVFVVLFVGFAVAQGLGKPSVPSDAIAVVEDASPSGGNVTITDTQYQAALRQAALRSQLKTVPKPSDPKFAAVQTAAVGDLLDIVWIQGEASEEGITVTNREVKAKLAELKKQNFQTEAEYQKFIKQSGYTEKDVLLRVRLQVLSTDIQTAITQSAPAVSSQQVSDYYQAAKTQFTTPESRDIRIIQNPDKAKIEQAQKALVADSSDLSWQAIARKYSTDATSKGNGGLRAGTTAGLLPEPVNTEVFAAPQKKVLGPFQVTTGPKATQGYYLIEVEKVTPEVVQPLAAVGKQIKSQLTQQAQQTALQDFINNYSAKWTARTVCSSEIAAIENRCSNFSGSVRPTNAPASCYQANPKKSPTGCPAPVPQLAPALPGTSNALNLQGTRLPQRPRPLGLKPAPAAGVAGATTGIPPGATAAP